ncbi:hypothetical protein [Actinomycetospora cinnamomea]|uniref:Uncharacterized protein n=1 Tax=Actinomycetospora cinnamomea TaxID=663609 RepID=A0A2U1F6A4_9PSEU|nr:hypothetical protein [Actinomycetospora cinnamomea]PVZ07694.1 hypothetical protein C8D89_11165 [Actinomycetospora cinnamomea]
MTTLAPPRIVHLDPVDHGLVDPARGSRALDAVLDQARAAEADGAALVVVPAGPRDVPAGPRWPSTAQALAVLLATTSVRVAVGVHPTAWDPATLARFARSAAGLAADRLVVQVHGPDAGTFATALAARWPGAVVVGEAGLRTLA